MFLGDSPFPFTCLVSFIFGYYAGKDQEYIYTGEIIPHDFHEFVTEYYGKEYPDSGNGWMTFIRENTKSEKEAFNKFFELIELYLHKTDAEQGA